MLRTDIWVIAIILVMSSQLLSAHSGIAQITKGYTQTPPKVSSVTLDKTRNSFTLDIEPNIVVNKPIVQYFSLETGETIMAVDFPGLEWNKPSFNLTPGNATFSNLRIGQFQQYPPVLRISIKSSFATMLKKTDFHAYPGKLVITLPQDNFSSFSNPNSSLPLTNNLAVVSKQVFLSSHMKAGLSLDHPQLGNKKFNQSKTLSTIPAGGLYLSVKSEGAANQYVTSLSDSANAKGTVKNNDRADYVPGAGITDVNVSGILKGTPNIIGHSKASDKGPVLQESNQTAAVLEQHSTRNLINTILIEKQESPINSFPDDINQINSEKKNIEVNGHNPVCVQIPLDPSTSFSAFRLNDPARYVIDINGKVDFCKPSFTVEKNFCLKDIRIGIPDTAIDKTRIVFDLENEYCSINQSFQVGSKKLIIFLYTLPDKNYVAQGKKVVLDAGHGGNDPGAQRGDIDEKKLTLTITEKLKQFLEELGLKVIMTREDDRYVSLEDRARLTNATAPDAFVSIHINSLETDSSICGIETYYQTEQSKLLASQIHDCLVNNLQVPDRSIRKARFYVINHTLRPAVLAEVGFISNKDEREKLISPEYQQKIAEAMGQGLIQFLSKDNQTDLSTQVSMKSQVDFKKNKNQFNHKLIAQEREK